MKVLNSLLPIAYIKVGKIIEVFDRMDVKVNEANL